MNKLDFSIQSICEQNSFPIFGNSVHVNILGKTKLCSFNCTYCALGPSEVRMNQIKKSDTFSSELEIDSALREILRDNLKDEPINNIIVSGNGEPTLHPQFSDIVDLIISAKNEISSGSQLVLFTNGAHIERKILTAIHKFDEIYVKLDAGNDNVFKSLNAPLIRANSSKIITNIRNLDDCIVQSLFVGGPNGNNSDKAIEEWLEVIGIIKPKKILLQTAFEPPGEGLQRLEENDLYVIVSKVKRKLGLECEVFFG